MARWKKGTNEFSVNVNYDNKHGSTSRIPKPILRKMKNPDKIKFIVSKKEIKIKRG